MAFDGSEPRSEEWKAGAQAVINSMRRDTDRLLTELPPADETVKLRNAVHMLADAYEKTINP